ncbi:MAG: HDOD domain-containing protein [Phycisphaerales bacterium]|nr:HDOD domain-containing protein [Phycisphaerales bacterium]
MTATLATIDHLDIHAAEEAVGVRPETALRLMQLAADEKSRVEELQSVIDADPSMTMRTLKLANSSFYGMPTRVSRTDKAITMLGVATIAKLASSTSVESAFRGIKIDAPGVNAKTPWRYSLSVAFATDVIAAECTVSSAVGVRRLSAEAFVTGLIHDIGTLVQAKLHTQAFNAAVNTSLKTGLPLTTVERRTIGIDHAQIGLRLAHHWSLPETLASGIGFHHDPLAAEPDHRALACVIHLAAQLVRRAGVASFDGDADMPHVEPAMNFLHIDPRRADHLVAAITQRVQSIDV